MPRLRTNNVFGTTTNNPLLVAGTTLNSGGLADLPVIASPNVAVLTLDPNRAGGAPEIIHVTAHTALATSATILRGQEGTVARQHPVGTFWVHAATVTDWGTDWAAYTPTFVNFTLGNGTINAARFVQVGGTVHWRVDVTLGSTSSMGTNPTVTLPVAAVATYQNIAWVGDMQILDAGTAVFGGFVRWSSTTVGALQVWNAASTTLVRAGITSAVPMTWTTTDAFSINGHYEAA